LRKCSGINVRFPLFKMLGFWPATAYVWDMSLLCSDFLIV
jgi:hypothetical protein